MNLPNNHILIIIDSKIRTAFLYLDKNACSVISFWFGIDVIVWRQLELCVFCA